ncbi:MAG: hydroxymethylglutaryl-CoA lyase [Bacteroidota bacterium]
MIQITECPRDAMQGLADFIPTKTKIQYLNALLRVGFDTLDFGSYVSPKAVPQMADTAEVLAGLDLSGTSTKLLAIVANRRGAETAAAQAAIHYLGYPFSVSETFQQRNTHKSMAESLDLVKEMLELCADAGKELMVYLSMAFGNPYGDPWSPALVAQWAEKLVAVGVKHLALADTVGTADGESIQELFTQLLPRFPKVQLGAHLHAKPTERLDKIATAYEAGCRRFDVAMRGFGGCPFADDELTGNVSTESLLEFCDSHRVALSIDRPAFMEAGQLALQVFG